MQGKPYVSEICDNSHLSHKVVGEANPDQTYASHALPSDRDLDAYKRFELFFTEKDKFHLNNNFDKNHCKIFLQDKEVCLENMNLDDHINEEIFPVNSKDYSKIEDKKEEIINNNKINDETKNNDNCNNINNNYINCNENKNINNNLNINTNNKNDALLRNPSNVSNTNYNNITNLFDTGKGDLLSIILGFGK